MENYKLQTVRPDGTKTAPEERNVFKKA